LTLPITRVATSSPKDLFTLTTKKGACFANLSSHVVF
jgi:hypothetical protein